MSSRERSWFHAPLATVVVLAACTAAPTTPETIGKTGTNRPAKKPSPTASVKASPAGSSKPSASPSPPASPPTTPKPSASASGAGLGTPTPSPSASGTVPVTPAGSASPSSVPVPSNVPSPGNAAVGTFAGTGAVGMINGGANGTATFKEPRGLAVGSDGAVYIADTGNHMIRKVKDGQVTTVLGDGTFTTPNDAARLRSPEDVAVGRDGVVYISDTANHRIRKHRPGTVDAGGKPITDWIIGNGGQGFADGEADTAEVNSPSGIALTDDQTKLWVVDSGNNTIRLITLATRAVVTVAGKAGVDGNADGTGETARFSVPKGCFALGNDTLYVADSGNEKIRKVVLAGNTGTVTTVDFPGLFSPSDVVRFGPYLFVTDEVRRTVERKEEASGTVELLARSQQQGFIDGDALTTAQFHSLADLLLLPTGEVLVADYGNNRIRKITRK